MIQDNFSRNESQIYVFSFLFNINNTTENVQKIMLYIKLYYFSYDDYSIKIYRTSTQEF